MSVKKKFTAASEGQQEQVVEAGTSTRSNTVDLCYGKFSSQSVHSGYIGDYSNILSVIEHLIGEGIRNFFNDPENRKLISECMTQNMGQKKQQHSSVVRDISSNEILRPRDLPQATGLSKTNIWRLEKEGKFVKKLKLSNGCVGYLRSDVESWLSSK